MISPSYPEPLCDIEAQFQAVCDPAHPKQAMWVADGTPYPQTRRSSSGPIMTLHRPGGYLITSRLADVRRPIEDDAELAEILGYTEPKWSVASDCLVMRALNFERCVIIEMAVSQARVKEAHEVVKAYGDPELTTIGAALQRRRILRALERELAA